MPEDTEGTAVSASETSFGTPSITMKVAERIKVCAPEVEGRLVDSLVEKEVTRRVELIGQALGKLDEMDRDRRKLAKPTHVTYNADRSVNSETFSKDALDALEKHDQKRSKLQKATDKALSGDLGDLPGILKQ